MLPYGSQNLIPKTKRIVQGLYDKHSELMGCIVAQILNSLKTLANSSS